MFHIRDKKLPKDPSFPADLRQLGFFISEDDRVSRIDDPGSGFRYRISDSDRVKEIHHESVCGCLRNVVISRLTDTAGPLSTLYIPHLTTEKPSDDTPHLPIICTALTELRQKSRIILIVNDSSTDLAIWSWPAVLKNEKSAIVRGSALSLILEVMSRANIAKTETPGFIVLNPGQLLYSFKQAKAVTIKTWNALPRESALHPSPGTYNNRIPGNETPTDHIRFVLDNIVNNPELVLPAARLFMIGLSTGAMNLLTVMQELVRHEDLLVQRIGAIAMTSTYQTVSSSLPELESNDPDSRIVAELHSFLRARAREWHRSSHPIDTPLANPSVTELATSSGSTSKGCYYNVKPWPTVAGGNVLDPLDVFVECFEHVVDWFQDVEFTDVYGEDVYSNGLLKIPEFVTKGIEELNHKTQLAWSSDNDQQESARLHQSKDKGNNSKYQETYRMEDEGNKPQPSNLL